VNERRSLKLRPFERCAPKFSAREIDFRQYRKVKNCASQVAPACAKDVISPLGLFRIIELEAFIDVEPGQDERAG
jgi:hypothetical protein